MVLLTHISMLILALCVLSAVALYEVSLSQARIPARKWMLLHLWPWLAFCLITFADYVYYTDGTRYFYILQFPAVLCAAIAYGELCYAVAKTASKTHLKLYRTCVGLGTALWVLWFIYTVFIAQSELYGGRYNFLALLPILLFFWPTFFLGSALDRNSLKSSSVRGGFKHFKALPAQQKAVLGFFLASLLKIISSVVPVAGGSLTDLPWEVMISVYHINNAVTFAVMMVCYFLYVEQRANLASKITSLLSVMLLITFIFVTMASFSEEKPLRKDDEFFLKQNELLFTPSNGGYRVSIRRQSHVPDKLDHRMLGADETARIALPFAATLFGKTYSHAYIYPDGQLTLSNSSEATVPEVSYYKCIDTHPVIAAFCSPSQVFDIYTAETDGAYWVLWANPKADSDGEPDIAFYAVLSPTGQTALGYTDSLPSRASVQLSSFIGLYDGTSPRYIDGSLEAIPFVTTGGTIWFDMTTSRRIAVNEELKPAVLFLLASILVVMFGLRPYLVRSLVRPIQSIREGLQGVDEGRFDKQLDVKTVDEFSDIAAGFNHMTRSLDEARAVADEQAELVEAELTHRTIEAAKKLDPNLLSKDQAFEERIRDVIEQNLSKTDFQVAELADTMATSVRQLHRRVVNLTAQTPATLVRNMRLDHAHRLLTARAVNVSEAAYASGFRDVSYFTKLFQKKFGMAPSELLKSD